MIFAVFDVLLAVNMCINNSFYIYICSIITTEHIWNKKTGHVIALDGVYLTKKKSDYLRPLKSYGGGPKFK